MRMTKVRIAGLMAALAALFLLSVGAIALAHGKHATGVAYQPFML